MKRTAKHRTEKTTSLALWALAASMLVSTPACKTHTTLPRAQYETDPLSAALRASRDEDWDSAAQYWNEVFLQAEGKNMRACLETARALKHLGDPESASNMLQLGLREDPDNPDLLEMKGDSLVDLGFRRSAEACYERCLANDPDRIRVLVNLGCLRLSLDREEAALIPLQKAVDLGCDDPDVLSELARAYRGTGQPVRAWKIFRQRMEDAHSDCPQLASEIGSLVVEPRVVSSDPSARERALSWLERSLEQDPQATCAHFQSGVLKEELGDVEGAIECYRRAVETDPAFLPGLTNLALLYAARGEEEHCREMVTRAITLEDDRERRRALRRILDRFES